MMLKMCLLSLFVFTGCANRLRGSSASNHMTNETDGRSPYGQSRTFTCPNGHPYTCNTGTQWCYDNSTYYCHSSFNHSINMIDGNHTINQTVYSHDGYMGKMICISCGDGQYVQCHSGAKDCFNNSQTYCTDIIFKYLYA